jgi:hypothetical protein
MIRYSLIWKYRNISRDCQYKCIVFKGLSCSQEFEDTKGVIRIRKSTTNSMNMTKWTVYLSRNCQNCHYYHHYFFLLQCFKKSTMLKSPTNSMKLTYINTMNSLFFSSSCQTFYYHYYFCYNVFKSPPCYNSLQIQW